MIKNEKIRSLINTGIKSKKKDPLSDFTPLSYKRLELYIEELEVQVIESGKLLPKVV